MSNEGPRLRRSKDGYAYAKFNGKKMHFGRFDDPQARIQFAGLKAVWEANGRTLTDDMLPSKQQSRQLTVGGMCDLYVSHLREKHDAKWLGNNLTRVDLSLRPLRELYGNDDAAEFSPKRLTAVRHNLIDAGKLCRKEINDRVRRIRAAFTWAVAEELVPGSLAHTLDAVKALAQGEYGTHEGREVRPVARDDVDASLPFLSKPVAALVELMWWTGARPSELFGLRPCDIDRSGEVWVAALKHHKNAKRGKRRSIFFGPEAQKVLKPFLHRGKDKPLFSPKEAVEEMERGRRAARATPLWPSHEARYKRQRAEGNSRKIGDVYTASSFRVAIQRAVVAANRKRPDEGKQPLPNWFPYQLRHAAATRMKRDHGLDAVRALLGHSSASMTETYAEDDMEKARAVMREAG